VSVQRPWACQAPQVFLYLMRGKVTLVWQCVRLVHVGDLVVTWLRLIVLVELLLLLLVLVVVLLLLCQKRPLCCQVLRKVALLFLNFS
jgi:hypothetical protein